ncbi:MAG TPA: VWA domain-containing protein, partial [Polyangiaceae bacterium]|nr:VWA domain-containing protein [Polyangiaceae bacterium]
ARSGSPSYYGVQDADELVDTVGNLGLGVALSCTLPLDEPPPDPTLVNVYFDGKIVPSDPIDGWIFVDEKTVQLLGASCQLLRSGQVLQADVIAGCPVVIH